MYNLYLSLLLIGYMGVFSGNKFSIFFFFFFFFCYLINVQVSDSLIIIGSRKITKQSRDRMISIPLELGVLQQVQTCFRLLEINFYYYKNSILILGKKILNRNENQI